MTDASAIQQKPRKQENSLTVGFNKLINTQYWRMMAERITPRAIPFVASLALTSGTLMSGALATLPPSGKAAGLMLLGAATLVTGARFLTTKLPSKMDAARRIDAISPTKHQVAENIYKDLNNPKDDPVWRLHVERLLQDVPKLITEDWRPSETVKKMALPLLLPAALALSAGAYTGYGHYTDNVRDSFNMTLNVPPAPSSRINAWVMQPGYTGEFAPIVLSDGDDGEQFVATRPVEVIEGSTLTIQLFDEDTEVTATSGDEALASGIEVNTRGRTREITVTLTEDTNISISRGLWSGYQWSFDVHEDRAPSVRLEEIDDPDSEDPVYRVIINDDFGADITDSRVTIPGAETDQGGTSRRERSPLPQYRDNGINLDLR